MNKNVESTGEEVLSEIDEANRLVALATSFGLQETAEMALIRRRLVTAFKGKEDLEETRRLYQHYEDLAMATVVQNGDVQVQIGLLLLKAALYVEAGDVSAYDEHLYDAMLDAHNADLPELVKLIRGE